MMLHRAWTRRLITIPGVYVGLILYTAVLPLVLVLALALDLVRWSVAGTPAMTVRIVVFGWLYLVGEAWALLAMAGVGLVAREKSISATYRLQKMWLDWNFVSLRTVFSLEFVVEGSESTRPGPILLLSRHASLIDTMLPGRYVVRPHGVRLRYVLKKELLIDPVLDIGGNRLPNCFVDRTGEGRAELRRIRDLASDLGPHEGVLIYPEGTRYSDEKRQRYTQLLGRKGGRMGSIAAGYRRVLPPRPGGTLTLLDATEADVVVLAHSGLEGFSSLAEIWSGGLVGSRIDVRFWRVPRSEIPQSREMRTEWLFDLWSEIDAWVVTRSHRVVPGPKRRPRK